MGDMEGAYAATSTGNAAPLKHPRPKAENMRVAPPLRTARENRCECLYGSRLSAGRP